MDGVKCGPGAGRIPWSPGWLLVVAVAGVAALLALAPAGSGRALAQSPCFTQAPGSPVPAGNEPYFVATGDFNADGRPDLAVANQFGDNVTILLGNGGGTFVQAPGSPVAVGGGPRSLAVGDFNADGRLDLAVANPGTDNVTILLGNGNGTFTQAPGSPIGVGALPSSVAVGDFNADGRLDLVVANGRDNNLTILLGSGNGTFTQAPGSPIAVGDFPFAVMVADFTADGRLDLAVANLFSDSVTILLGNGNGTFVQAPGSPIAVGNDPMSVAVGDFTADGRLDLAVANDASDTVTILLGNGNGTFTQAPGSPIGVGSFPVSVAAGDFNTDGRLDLAVANSGSAGNSVTILLGNGNGTFTQAPGSPVPVGQGPASVAVGDFNADGRPDLAVANRHANNVTILLGPCGPPVPTAAATPTATRTSTPTATATRTATATPTPTTTATATVTSTATPTRTATVTPSTAPTLVVVPASNPPAVSGTPTVPCTSTVGTTCTVAGGGGGNSVAGTWQKNGSGAFTLTATAGPGVIVGSIPAVFLPTTAGIESPPGACAAVSAGFTTTCTGVTAGDLLLGALVTVRFAVPAGTIDVVGTVSGPGPAVTARPAITTSVAPSIPAAALGFGPPPLIPPLIPPPALLFGPPPPPPPPPAAAALPPGIPVIPETETASLLAAGLMAVIGIAMCRRFCTRHD